MTLAALWVLGQAAAELRETVARLSREIEARPAEVKAYSARGDAYFFLGDAARAAADYDRMIALDATQGPPHWRRGIALFYAGRYAEAARQFEQFHTVDAVDRENGIWRFLSQAREQGVARARANLLKYDRADREPFPAIYRMIGGEIGADAVAAAIESAAIDESERVKRRFYAHLYVGLLRAVEDRPAEALEPLRRAAANPWPERAGFGPHYMRHVARVHAERLEEQLRLLKTFRDEFVAITPGRGGFPAEFVMGSAAEAPAHRVALAAPFEIARYEVPQNLWESVMGSNPSRWKGPRNSVELISFDDAAAFCARATALMRSAGLIGVDQSVRLPSEAEWEYAARAGSAAAYSFGDDPAALGDYAWFHGNAAGNDPPVGAKKPNAWGLYDVHGYLWEWCADEWHETYEGAPADGSVWAGGGDAARRVLRGGSWKDGAEKLTSSARRAAPRGLRDDAVGLRCVLSGGSGR
jgi:formylglycine-generating enzyme required for sulfatase activity